MSGVLYLCATPIGNLEDMTYRAVRVLEEADLIAAEDTRNSRKLLSHFDIHTPMTSYHEHNKYEKAEELIEKLRNGINIALITDAGMPGISDPGEVLCRRAHEEGITVTIVPGACAAVSALAVSGRPSGHFVFEGFLYGFAPSLLDIPANILQGAFGIVLGVTAAKVFEKSHIEF